MPSSLIDFIRVLRSHEVRVSPAETLDAMAVATTLGFDNRDYLRDGLGMALAKTPSEEAVFLQCFDRYFRRDLSDFSLREESPFSAEESAPTRIGAAPEVAAGMDTPQGDLSPLQAAAGREPTLQALLETPLMRSLLDNNRNELSLALERAAHGVGLNQISLFTQRGQFTRRLLDELGEQHIRDAVIALERSDHPALPELRRYRDLLREQVRDYVERAYLLNAEGSQRQLMENILAKTRLNNIQPGYLERVHQLVRKMAKKLATRHSRRRRPLRRGQLDMARTLRRGAATDGILFDTHWRRRKKDRPQLLALCDVSGSVATYARFLLLFLYSLQDILPKTRSFAFSSHLGEVSELFDEHPPERAIELVNLKYGGATDYGNSLADFATLALEDINSNTTVLILGDARNNRGDPRLDILQSLYQRARQVIWLNPESRPAWGTGDSEMLRYQCACHFTAECNNLQQLERIVDQLLRTTG